MTKTTTEPVEMLGLAGDQPEAFRTITQLIQQRQRYIKLCGFAGTGKTWMTAQIAKWALRHGYEVTVVAPTHKAAGVIEDKLRKADVTDCEVKTIHSLLGLRLEPDYENDTGGRVLVAPETMKSKPKGIIICDEASMCGETLHHHIQKTQDVVWLFVGDLAQLPPVGEGLSELLNDPDATLEQVLRQAQGSEILNLATRIRKGDKSMDHAEGKDVTQLDSAEELFQAALERFDTPEYRKDATFARMLVFKNSRRKSINLRMRELLVGAEEPYVPGEWLVMYAAFSPEKSRLNVLSEQARQYRKGERAYGQAWKRFFNYKESLGDNVTQLHVSEEVLVESVEETTVSVGKDSFGVWSLVVKAREDEHFTLPVLKPEELERFDTLRNDAIAEAQGIRAEQAKVEKFIKRNGYDIINPAWEQLDQARRKCWQRYFVLDETFASVDYSYAMTVHKSQGSTFQHAFIDVPDLLSSGGMQNRILYTAVTRPAKSLTFYI